MVNYSSATDRSSCSNRLKEEGALYRKARRHAGFLRSELAGDLINANCPTNMVEISALEAGLISTADLPEQFPPTFRQTLLQKLERPTQRN